MIFLATAAIFSISAWTYSETSFDIEGRIAMVAQAGRFNPYIELKGQYHSLENQLRYTSLSAGSYFSIVPWLKIGAFYRMQMGARDLEDWQFEAGPPDRHWWLDTRGQIEHLFYFDATPRFHLSWLPGRNWVFPTKIRYYYNVSNRHHSLLIRPGLTYVFMTDREPLLNLSFNYNLYFALNTGDIPLYSHGPYLSVIGHVYDWLKLEGKASYRYATYFKEDGGSWTLNSSQITVGLGVIFTPDFSLLRKK